MPLPARTAPAAGVERRLSSALKMLVKSSIRPAETIRCAACRTGLVGYFGSFLYSREWRLTRCRLSLCIFRSCGKAPP